MIHIYAKERRLLKRKADYIMQDCIQTFHLFEQKLDKKAEAVFEINSCILDFLLLTIFSFPFSSLRRKYS